jgi:ribonuclease E
MTIHTLPGDDRPEPEFDNSPLSNDAAEPSSEEPGFGAGVAGAAGTKGKTKRRPARRKAAKKPTDEGGASDTAKKKRTARKAVRKKVVAEADDPSGDPESPAPARKKRSRRAKPVESAESTESAEPAVSTEDGSEASDGANKRRRRRGSRGGRRRRKKAGAGDDAVEVDALPGDENDLPDLPDDAELVEGGSEGGGKKKRRRRRSRKKATGSDRQADGGGRQAGGSDRQADGSDRQADGGGRRTAKKAGRKKSSKKKAARRSSAEDADDVVVVEDEAVRDMQILVNAVDPEEKRVAVFEGERITDLLMTSDSQKSLVNDIYRGRVVNLEPAIGAAFVDFGQGRNGFLHTSDVISVYGEKGFTLDQLLTSKVDPEEWDEAPGQPSVAEEMDEEEEPAADKAKDAKETPAKSRARGKGRPQRRGRERRPISDLLRVGDQVVVQVTKDAIGDKGPTLTTYISIPGRYLVLMPSMARTGVSRKIPDDKERRRLKRILAAIDPPEDMGVIVRTAGVGKTKKDLKRDLDYLLGVWENFGRRLNKGRGPAALYQESNVAIRTLRDLFGATTKEVIVDDPVVFDELTEFAEKLMPEHKDRIRLHDGERPLFHHYGLEQDFEKVFARRVELPSGGSIVFDQAEALVAIDVNSGRTRTKSFDFEEIALKTNLEAVPEIARQIRLRDLGGILVCDFIDMMKSSSNRTVERALRTNMVGDRARSKLGRISQFGLLEMTRQRLGPGTHKKVFMACPRCRGTARIRTVQSRAQSILRRLGSALTQKGFTTVEVRAHPEVVDYLHDTLWDYVRALEHRFEKEITTTPVPDQPEDSVLRYLRADGREVRPGGRRKR